MLLFTDRQMRRLHSHGTDSFRNRVDAWLAAEHANWAEQDSIARQDVLHDMIAEAGKAGMIVETDYAVFCGVLVAAPGVGVENWDAMLTRPEIEEVLTSDWKPAAKLVRMERLLAEIPEDLS